LDKEMEERRIALDKERLNFQKILEMERANTEKKRASDEREIIPAEI
jgi:hypothetical protein